MKTTILFLAMTFAATWAVPTPAAGPRDVFTLTNGVLYLDGRRHAELSFNKFDLFWSLYDAAKTGQRLDDTNGVVMAQDRALAELEGWGLRTIRIFGMPWAHWEWAPVWEDPKKRVSIFYAAVEKTLDLCEKHGIAVVWSLAAGDFVDKALVNGVWVAGEEHTRELMANPGSRSRKRLEEFLSTFIPRYAPRKSIVMWEIGNEITLKADIGNDSGVFEGVRVPTLAQVAGFYRDVTGLIKKADPLRLVNNGGSRPREAQWNRFQKKGWAPDRPDDHQKVFDLLFKDTGVDLIDIHSYPNQLKHYTLRNEDGSDFPLDHLGYFQMAQKTGKPLMIGELGALPKLKAQNKKLYEAAPGYFESFSDVAGALPWVKACVDGVVGTGIPLVYWWAYSSDRPMDQKAPDRMDLKKGRDDALLAVILEGNKRLKARVLGR